MGLFYFLRPRISLPWGAPAHKQTGNAQPGTSTYTSVTIKGYDASQGWIEMIQDGFESVRCPRHFYRLSEACDVV